MKITEVQALNRTIKFMIVSHRFKNYPNIVCSSRKIYQLPCCVGKKSFGLKEILPKYHQGSIVYIIESKRINSKYLKKISYKFEENIIIDEKQNFPF